MCTSKPVEKPNDGSVKELQKAREEFQIRMTTGFTEKKVTKLSKGGTGVPQ